jgi:hypothetical protein
MLKFIGKTIQVRDANGHVAALPTSAINSRRLITDPLLRTGIGPAQTNIAEGVVCEAANVRFGSEADICAATSHVRFTPNSDRESDFPQTVMSALPPKADMCSALAHVCFGPKADILRSGNDVRFMPKSGRLHRESLVAVMSHFHEESSLLCELSHNRKRRAANTLPQCQVSH